MLKCLVYDPKARISWEGICEHPFIKTDTVTEVDWKNFEAKNGIISISDKFVKLNTNRENYDTESLKKQEIKKEPEKPVVHEIENSIIIDLKNEDDSNNLDTKSTENSSISKSFDKISGVD